MRHSKDCPDCYPPGSRDAEITALRKRVEELEAQIADMARRLWRKRDLEAVADAARDLYDVSRPFKAAESLLRYALSVLDEKTEEK